MLIYPAIDLYKGEAVRLTKGDYNDKTVYNEEPLNVAYDFLNAGAKQIHVVDLEGAKDGWGVNFDIIKDIKEKTGLFVETGGGIRDMESIKRYIDCGIDRVILGTKAAEDPSFVTEAVNTYADKIAVGIDIKDGYVAIKGWLEKSKFKAEDFLEDMCAKGVKTFICTDISKDGMMEGANLDLYKNLVNKFKEINLIASGGVSSLDDIKKLKDAGMFGAIIGKAYYEGAINLKEAVEIAENGENN